MRDFPYSFGRNVSFSIKKTFARGFIKILKIDKVIKIHIPSILHISIYGKSNRLATVSGTWRWESYQRELNCFTNNEASLASLPPL